MFQIAVGLRFLHKKGIVYTRINDLETFFLLEEDEGESRVVTVPVEPDGATHGGITNTEAGTATY